METAIIVGVVFLIPYIIGTVLGIRTGYRWGRQDAFDEVKAILSRKDEHAV